MRMVAAGDLRGGKSDNEDFDCRELAGTPHTNYYGGFLARLKRRKHLFESTFLKALRIILPSSVPV